jgi:hypothetical protein
LDEASQCDIPSALPLLFRARRALVIGDPHQLRHIGTLRISDEEDLAAQHGLGDEVSRWSYNQRSLYNLAEQMAAVRGQPLGVFWHDAGLLQDARISVGVVTPFRLQMKKIKERLGRRPWHSSVDGKVVVGTAHRFQGDECDIMVFSPVVSGGMLPRLLRWVAYTEQLLNVAITRARGALHVLGDMRACLEAGGSPAEQAVADMLRELGLLHKSQCPLDRHRLDFLVVSPGGTVFRKPEQVKTVLSRL